MRNWLYQIFVQRTTNECYRGSLHYVPNGSRLLDVGIGNGLMIETFHPLIRFKKLRITGIDIDAGYLDHCRELNTPFETPGGNGPYQEHLRRIGRLDAYCRDIAERVEKGQYWPHPSAVAPEDHNDTFVAGAAIDFLRNQPAAFFQRPVL